jgi:solute:Na+ symporter, SSS family
VLAGFVALYLLASIAVGLYAATRVRDAGDYAVASRRFGTTIATATVFATWFGAETVLGIPAAFWKEGLGGVVADPFAAVACLVLVALVYARPLFRLDAITLGDYFRARFGRTSEILLSLCIAYSYLGWIAAQFVALGLAFDVLSGGAIDLRTGIVIGAAVVLVYTIAGGMWSVALTDFFQAAVIVAGLLYVAWSVADAAGGAARVLDEARTAGKLGFSMPADTKGALAMLSAALIVVFGSVPQQDVFQRIRSARDEATAVRASLLGGILYFAIACVPMFLVAAAAVIDPALVERLIAKDHQLILPTLILERTPLAAQVLFFGALLSAILSTASGALLAPAVTIAENLLRPLLPPLDDRALLRTMRLTVFGLGLAVAAMALASRLSIYDLVVESGKVVLAGAFVPLTAGLFWKRANERGSLAAVIAGIGVWLGMEALAPDGTLPAVLGGLLASAIGMAGGSLIPMRGVSGGR